MIGGSHIQVYCRVRPYAKEDHISVTFPDAIEYLEQKRSLRGDYDEHHTHSDTQASDEKEACLHLMQQCPAQILVGEKSTFAVDRLFYGITQDEIYEETVRPIIDQDLFKGIHCTLFSYGQTGSGKTHTLIGSNQHRDDRGLLPRSLEQIFETIDCNSNDNISYSCEVKVSIVEIYHEKLKDLLGIDVNSAPPTSSSSVGTSLAIREQSDGTIYVENLREIPIFGTQDFNKLLSQALKRRVTGGHKLNEHSSRSHLCCLISLTQIDKANSTEISSKLSIIDLAGSEMAKKTEAVGQRFQEAKFINKSLSALSKVIGALTVTSTTSIVASASVNNENSGGNTIASILSNNPNAKPNSSLKLSNSTQLNNTTGMGNGNNKDAVHIPYRDSKLTRLLQNSLSGSNKTVIILTISPLKQHMSETISTLKFGERARLIKITPKIHQQIVEKDENLRGVIKDLKNQILVLQQTITKMKEEAAAQALINANNSTFNSLVNEYAYLTGKDASSVPIGETSNRLVTAICEVCQAFIDQSLHDDEDSNGEQMKKSKCQQLKKKKSKLVIEKGLLSSQQSPRIDELTSSSSFIFFPPNDIAIDNEDDQRHTEHRSIGKDTCDEDDNDDPRFGIDDDEIIDRCAICGMNSEESEQLKIDTGEELGFLFNCDGNCGNKFHIRCIGIVGDGGQYMMPEGEWFCTSCTTNINDNIVDVIAPESPQTPRLLRINPQSLMTPIQSSAQQLPTEGENDRDDNYLSDVGGDRNDTHEGVDGDDPLEKLDQISTPQVQSHYYPKPENLISAFQNLHFRYELMRKERNRILLHWQNEKKTQQHIEALKQKKLVKDQEEKVLYLEEKQVLTSSVKSLEDENAYLRKCLNDIREEVVASSHRKYRQQVRNQKSPDKVSINKNRLHGSFHYDEEDEVEVIMGEEWKSLSKRYEEIQPPVSTSGGFSGLFGFEQRKEAQEVDIGTTGIEELRDMNHSRNQEPSLPKPQPWAGGMKKSTSEIISPQSKDQSIEGLGSNSLTSMDNRSTSGKALHPTPIPQEENDFQPKEQSRFVNPLKNRLSDLLAKVKEEADSYAEIRSKYQNINRERSIEES